MSGHWRKFPPAGESFPGQRRYCSPSACVDLRLRTAVGGTGRCGNGTVRQETREKAVRSPRPPRLLTPPPTLPVDLEQLQEASTSSRLPVASRPGEAQPETRFSCNHGTGHQYALRDSWERSQAGQAILRRQRLASRPSTALGGMPERSGTTSHPSGGHRRYQSRSLRVRGKCSRRVRTLQSAGPLPGR